MPAYSHSLVAEPHADRAAVTTVAAEPRANEPTPGPALIADARAERGTESTLPGSTTTPIAGPSARLRALPQPAAEQLTTPDGVDHHLAQLETARQAQLDALPAAPRNVVAAAHRETVEWILEQVRTARQRLRADVYGLCARCGTRIPPDRLTAQPWVNTCTVCDPPDRPILSPVPTPG